MSSPATVAANLLENGMLVDAEKLGGGAGGSAYLCKAGPNVESPITVVLKIPHLRGPHTEFMDVFETEVALEVQEAGLPSLCLGRDSAAAVINRAALDLPEHGSDNSSHLGCQLQTQLARQFGVQVSRLGVPPLKVLESRWSSEPRLLFALAFNVVHYLKELNMIFIAHADCKPVNFLIDPDVKPNFFEGDVGGVFVDWGSARRGETLRRALAGDLEQRQQVQVERFDRCECGKILPIGTKRDDNNCPYCTKSVEPQNREGLFAAQPLEMGLISMWGPPPAWCTDFWDRAAALAEGNLGLEHELAIYADLFAGWHCVSNKLEELWDEPEKFDRVAYWQRVGSPKEHFLDIWHAGNRAWPEGQPCTADVVEASKAAMQAEVGRQLQRIL
mmetsp:Transcript_89093/g.247497  ORF Transcript_89093/g.247497 Transcript_89093/m.247497 type:complete len:388 (+) Transcript_89093:97-1260(+)|eukprot:CAMPEP_0179096024 /NCGR_PEP_ID=MMETSP0796-20121207/44118_1 /TAXON_ID=73915 /ORGANISM="Pyrodinium bahamense, Strain pbaha01" /LENGTH=387 /DNA_ID=CAMNT_0020793725 /DNA_START=1 /DNA_END=1164 /DNA_ORIENTATION=+